MVSLSAVCSPVSVGSSSSSGLIAMHETAQGGLRRTTRVIDSCPNEIFTYANGVLSAYLALVLATFLLLGVLYYRHMTTLRATRENRTERGVPAELLSPQRSINNRLVDSLASTRLLIATDADTGFNADVTFR